MARNSETANAIQVTFDVNVYPFFLVRPAGVPSVTGADKYYVVPHSPEINNFKIVEVPLDQCLLDHSAYVLSTKISVQKEYNQYVSEHLRHTAEWFIDSLCFEAELYAIAKELRSRGIINAQKEKEFIRRISLNQQRNMRSLVNMRLKRHNGRRTADYDISSLRKHYSQTYKQAKKAKESFKANKRSNKWKEHIKTDIPNMPHDLIARLSGNPADISGDTFYKLAEKGGTPKPSDIALEWAARLCKVPDYYYSLKTLKDKLTEQNKNHKNGLL